MKRFLSVITIVLACTNQSYGQSNIDSIIESGNFALAQEKIASFNIKTQVPFQFKLLSELNQFNKAAALITTQRAITGEQQYLILRSKLDLSTGNNLNSIKQLSNALNDSTTITEGKLLFELASQFNAIDSTLHAKICIIKSIQLLANTKNDTTKLDQLILFGDILSNSSKKLEALQIFNSAQVLSQAKETTLTDLKRKQYDVVLDLKRGIIMRELGQIDESMASLQSCEFKIHSIDKLWALKVKKALYQAFQITLFVQGNKDKMFAYNIKSSINKEIIDDLIYNYIDANISFYPKNELATNEQIEVSTLDKTTGHQSNNKFNRDDLINWILIGLLTLTIGVLTFILSKRKKENTIQKEQINELDMAFKLYQNQILSQSTSESKKIIQEIGMLSKRQSRWSKKISEIITTSSKTKKQDIIDSIEEISIEMSTDIKLDQKKAQLNDNVRKVSDDFKKRLKKRYPNLIRSEIELCALIRLRMSNKEIAEVRNISLSSARTARYRLKKKLNIPENLDIEQVLLAI